MDCTAGLLLAFVWDKTASGMARSNTDDRLHSLSAPRFNMGQNCLWDSEELKVNYLNNKSAPQFSMGQNCIWEGEEQG